MSTYNIIKLKNITPLHISKGKSFYDSLFDDVLSDSLTAALAAIRVNNKGKADDIKSFLDSFSLSSAFPFHQDQLYLPKPKGRIELGIDEKYRKKLKKIKYLEKSIFEAYYIDGKEVRINNGQIWQDLVSTQNFSESEIAPYKKHEVERVTIPRDGNNDAVPFFFEYKYFAPEAGLYCITDAQGELYDEIFDLFNILGEQGVGSDKNVGCGHFEVEKGTIELRDVESSDKLMLSMYLPTKEEMEQIDLDKSIYQVILRGGYMAGSADEAHRHFLKKALYMIESTSLIHCETSLVGKTENLRNEYAPHDIFRSGKALYIPIINKQ